MALRGGRYEILRMIASGGMATVHLGRSLGMGGFERLVAIKVMHPHVASEPECVDMFLDEARLAARIHHPNVVSTIDVSEDEEGVFLVMEFVEGPSLQGIMRGLKKKKQDAPFDVLLRIFMDTLAGLHAAHELPDVDGTPLNLVHRDVSPQNILIGTDGIARITDFGVARAETRLSATQGGQIKGKFAYMAPEQVRMLPVDRRADIYSAGVMLWEVLTGEKLLKSDNELGMLTQILAHKFATPHELKPRVPEKLSDMCMQALRFKAEERYPTAAAMAEAIEEAARASGIFVASARQVAVFIKELGAHEPVGDLNALAPERPLMRSPRPSLLLSNASISLGALNKSADVAQAAAAVPDVQVSEESASPVPADARAAEDGSGVTPPSATVTSTDRLQPAGRRGTWITAALVAAAVLVLAIVFGVSSSGDKEQAEAAPPPVVASAPPPVSAAPAADVSTAAPSASIAEAEAASAAPSASAPPEAKDAAQAGADSGSAADKKTKTKGKKPAVYRPWQL